MGCGEQCVEICGEQQMQLWCAGNLDSPVQVRDNTRGDRERRENRKVQSSEIME